MDKNHPILGFFVSWIREFSKNFDEVHVVALEVGIYNLPSNVTVYSLGKEDGENNLKYLWRFYLYFLKIFFFTRVDYVLFHMGAIYNILAAPFFLCRHFFDTKFFWWKTHGHINWQGRLALSFVDRVYTASAESFPINTKKRHVVGHAIDVELFSPFGNIMREKRILFTGRLTRSKRIEVIVELAKFLKERGVEVPVRIIGPVIDKDYVNSLKELVQNHELDDLVTFLPPLNQPELIKEYEAAEIFINPSNTGSIDKTVLEAMAMGAIPLTDNPAFMRMLGEFQLFTKKGDSENLLTSVLRILDLPNEVKNDLRNKLRNIVMSQHSLKTLSQRIFPVV